MTDIEAVELFAEFVYNEEVGTVSWIDDCFLVEYERGPGQLIKVCTAEEFNKNHKAITAAVLLRPSCDRLYIYLSGKRDSSIEIAIPGRKVTVCQIINAWYFYPQLLYADDKLGAYVRSRSVQAYSKELNELEIGDGEAYEQIVKYILRLSLFPIIGSIKTQTRSLNGRARRDILIALSGGIFAHHLYRALLPSNNLIVECKNKNKVEGTDVDQIARYLGPAKVASVGLLVTRVPLTKEMRSIIVENRRDNDGKIAIIPIDDGILLSMLENVKDSRFDRNEGMLIGLFENTLLDVH